jgi:hypothetical protein
VFSEEQIVEFSSWVLAVLLLILFVPLRQWRKASIALSFMQLITWMTGFWVVQFGWIEYPNRFFSRATMASVTFEYFVYPIVAVVFVIRYPLKHSILKKVGYTLAYPTIITIGEVFLEKYTETIEYHQWRWYWSWTTILAGLLCTHYYCEWFFQRLRKREQNDT